MQAFSDLKTQCERKDVCHFWSHLRPKKVSMKLQTGQFILLWFAESLINKIMDSLRAEICQLSNFLLVCKYSDEHTFKFGWTKTTLAFISLNLFLLCAEFFHIAATLSPKQPPLLISCTELDFFYCQQNCLNSIGGHLIIYFFCPVTSLPDEVRGSTWEVLLTQPRRETKLVLRGRRVEENAVLTSYMILTVSVTGGPIQFSSLHIHTYRNDMASKII